MADPGSELALGYAYRSERYRACTGPKQDTSPNPLVVAFGDGYRALANQVSQGRVVVGDFRGPANRRIGFAPWRKGFALWHNLTPGTIDLYVAPQSWTEGALRAWLVQLPPEQQPPAGWCVERAAGALALRYTGFPVADISSFETAQTFRGRSALS
jgi:hypothetical protein